jgi:hypothetical protein
VTDGTNPTDENMERRIEGRVRDLAREISTAPPGQRERLRDMAVHLLRDEVEIVQPIAAAPAAAGPMNPFGIGIPLVLVGGVLLILFPPVGLLLFAVAAFMMVWGVAAVMVRRES